MGEESASKEKASSRSSSRLKSAKKILIHEFEGTKMEMRGFMIQIMELWKKLNEEADNIATRLPFL